MQSSALFFFAIIQAGLVLVVMYQARNIQLGLASLGWRRTKGMANEAFVEEFSNGEGGFDHKAKVHYSYSVGGRRFESTRISFRVFILDSYEKQRSLLIGIEEGREIDVFYDPLRPQCCVLVRGVLKGNFVWLAIMIGFMVSWMLYIPHVIVHLT